MTLDPKGRVALIHAGYATVQALVLDGGLAPR